MIDKAIEVLNQHQQWRLGEKDEMPYKPLEITQALDEVLVFANDMNTLGSLQIFNLLFKGSQIRHTTWAKAFRTLKDLEDYINYYCDLKGLTNRSLMGDNGYVVQDRLGNSYYFLFHKENI